MAIVVSAQQARFFDSQYQLPGSLIDRIFQDPHGNVWFAGKSGAIKYGGITFTREQLRYANAPSVSWVKCMAFMDDEKILFGTSRGIVLNDCLKDTFQLLPAYVDNEIFDNYFVSSIIKCDKLGVWLATCSGNGITALSAQDLSPNKEITDRLNTLSDTKYPGALYIDSRNHLWTFSSEGNFIKIDLNTLTRLDIHLADGIDNPVVTNVVEVGNTGDLVICTSHHGILRYNAKDDKIYPTNATYDATGCVNAVLCPKGYGTGRTFWIGTEENGLMLFDYDTQTLRPAKIHNDRIDLLKCKIHDIFQDRHGNIWATAFQKGVVMIPKSAAIYSTNNQRMTTGDTKENLTFLSIPVSEGNAPNLGPVTSIAGKDGIVWAGTDGGGVISIGHGGIKKLVCNAQNGLPNNQVTAIESDNAGNLWIATFNGGLSRISQSGKITTPYTAPEYQKTSAMAFDSVHNTLYIGTLGYGTHAIRLINGNADSIYNIPYPQWVHKILVTSDGDVIVNSKATKTSSSINYEKINQITYEPCNSSAEDSQHNIYLGGEDWICKYNTRSDSLTFLDQTGLKGSVQSMTTDRYGNLWFTTQDQLVHYSDKEKRFETFATIDGLPSNEFCFNAIYQNPDGIIYIGTNSGMVVFDPQEGLQKPNLDAEIYFSGLSVAGDNITFHGNANIIDAPINYASRIMLNHSQNRFTLQFGINEYINQHRIRFKFRLKGFDDHWYDARQMSRSISFTNIPEGRYTLEIKAFFTNNEQHSIARNIDVIVLPPWYNSWWAYIIYTAIIIAILMSVKAVVKNRLTLRQQQEENNKKEMRLQMFTNLSHEIRTPLSLVETPLNSLLENETDKKKSAILQLMKRNVQRVTSQLNRIIDIRKIDNHKFVLKFQNTGIVDFISDIVKSFDQLSLTHNININLHADSPDLVFAFDPFNLDKVVFNILSNAFKFTPDGGFINITIKKEDQQQPQFVIVKIENSGSSIPAGELDKVFERYYQTSNNHLNEGSGIGMHLSKMIVEAHNGSIRASNTEHGVEFEFTLPYFLIDEDTDGNNQNTPQNTSTEHFIDIKQEQSTDTATNKNLRKILFIDDDTEWTSYLSIALSDTFNTIVCNKPETAMSMIIQCEPEAVVTDLVMPSMNGYEICKKIRQTPQTSLLPVIVLTSESDEESRRICVEIGADHYLTKPVSLNILRSSISNAIKIRQQLKNRITADVRAGKNIIDAESPDSVLIKKVTDAILDNLGNSSFGVNELSAMIGISRVHLNRKLKELLNITPVNLIKTIKMKQAAKLLIESRLNVADVAYKLGFSSHSYFSSHFKEYFGMSPTEFVAKYTKPENHTDFENLVR
ncbi:MAG: helix-turn-helix domain-containing protein [Bacteroidales bacterium]|nr:helix-turn-helix domain-containing protein [Bacteroidales bacterium]